MKVVHFLKKRMEMLVQMVYRNIFAGFIGATCFRIIFQFY